MKNKLLCVLLSLLPWFAFADGDHGDVTVEILVQSDKSWNGKVLAGLSTDAVSVVKVTVPPLKAQLAHAPID